MWIDFTELVAVLLTLQPHDQTTSVVSRFGGGRHAGCLAQCTRSDEGMGLCGAPLGCYVVQQPSNLDTGCVCVLYTYM